MLLENLSFGKKISVIMDFFKNIIIENIEKTKEKTKQKTTEIKSIAINQIKKYELDVKAFEWFLFCINQSNKIIIYFDRIYETNPKIQKFTDHSLYFLKYVYSAVSSQRIEPMETNWICTSVLMKRNTNLVGEEIYFNDTYEFMNKNVFMDLLKESCESISSIVSSTNNIIEGMITMKMGKKYINRIFFNKNEAKIETELPLVPSKHRFISVKYTHPNMDEPIFIDVNTEYYYANNEILSPLFIKRYLEYQPLIYDFDMNYELEIMDNDINTYVINSKQYILLADSTYTIKNIE
jgi:hypothetical protein